MLLSKSLANDTQSLLLPKQYCANDLYDAIGKVPIVRLNQLHTLCEKHKVYVKLDSCNPSGSIKDKNAVYLIKQAELQGLLKPGGTIIESSSGNFGLALASIGASKGYKVIIVIDAKTPPPVVKMLRAYGAELVEVPLTLADSAGSMQKARMAHAHKLAKEIVNSFYPCQHLNPDNPAAHQEYTAKEIAEAFSTPPDAVVVGVSTAGQLAGIARYFRDYSPSTKIICVDVAGSAVLGMPRHAYKMIGLGLSFVPPVFERRYLDYGYNVTDQIAFSMCHQLASKEGLLLGASTGAIVSAGLAYLQAQSRAVTIVLINPDRGDRYLDTVYDVKWLEQHDLALLNRCELMQAINNMQPVVFPEKTKGIVSEKL
ncbi:cysteine synthase family protein [Spartinivicinus poritis]|uniref:cysteine synthase n=1 Tax=Spartinivicinus poritis TaxID=2994640 RepID=A0ABT5U3B5_9GAMM|nr:cysteine synthase family protein [Spartinivicinus sp. A2-2]MDE1460710.1 cysteine synthase family protein [Spartinivicinus sp. A2-2]